MRHTFYRVVNGHKGVELCGESIVHGKFCSKIGKPNVFLFVDADRSAFFVVRRWEWWLHRLSEFIVRFVQKATRSRRMRSLRVLVMIR